MTMAKVFFSAVFLVTALSGIQPVSAGKIAAGDGTCTDEGPISYICNAMNVEDLVHISGTPWILAGRLPPRGQTQGGFSLIDIRDNSYMELTADLSHAPKAPFTACSGAPDPTHFMAHGMNIRFGRADKHTLYVVNHGERESIEIFDLDASGTKPALTWTGCVIAPENASLNSVAHLPDGGIAATSILDRSDPDSFKHLLAGEPNGFTLTWTPTEGWATVEGAAFSGNNGIEASADGNLLYVAGWGDASLNVVNRTTGSIQRIDMGNMQPDNIRYSDTGDLIITGQVGDTTEMFKCVQSSATKCTEPYKALSVDPETLRVITVVDAPGSDAFGSATTAVVVKGRAWLGTFRGDRVAVVDVLE